MNQAQKDPRVQKLQEQIFSDLFKDIFDDQSNAGCYRKAAEMEIRRRLSEDQVRNLNKSTAAIAKLGEEVSDLSDDLKTQIDSFNKASKFHGWAMIILTIGLVIAASVQAYSSYQSFNVQKDIANMQRALNNLKPLSPSLPTTSPQVPATSNP
jgi:hypothetical protein